MISLAPRLAARSLARALAVALGLALAESAVAQETASLGPVVPAGISVREDSARWESGYGEKFFQVVGTVSNGSEQMFGAILVRTELLDDGGKVVAICDAWNARAEALGDLKADAARTELAKLAPGPVAPGTSDRFRATFLADETPKFASHRIRVVSVLPPT